MFQEQSLVNEMDNLQKFALRLTRNAADAEDLVQSTVLRALEKKDLFQEGTNLFSWSSKIMFNLFVSNYRQKKKFETQYDPSSYIDQVSVGPSQESSADLLAVRDAMHQLSVEHRQILVMICVQGIRYEEAAEQLGIPVGTVRSRLYRARQELRDLLSVRGDDMEALPSASQISAMQARNGFIRGRAGAV